MAQRRMRGLAHELDVVPMALYKHVANKEQLLDGMVDVIVSGIDGGIDGETAPPAGDGGWKCAVRRRVLSARRALLRHPWAWRVIESRTRLTPVVLDYVDSLIATFRAGGLSVDLTHHAMYALGSRMWGFSQEVFPAGPPPDPDVPPAVLAELAARYPHIAEIALGRAHDGASVVGPGCDDQSEFEFALDLLLDGFERLHAQDWTPVR
jgi:AcrR family transcriptional regulator